MQRSPKALIVFALISTVMVGCRKDPAMEDATGSTGPTPLELNIPDWALAQIHPLNIPADNPTTVEGVALGRRLFYEKALSDNYTMSCASCHQQAHAFTDPLRFSVGTDGSMGTRNSMSVQNTLWDNFFFWDGRAASLEQQALGPVKNPIELRNTWPVVEQRIRLLPEYPELFRAAFGSTDIDSVRITKAIAQFERTLLSFGSRFDRYHYEGDSSALNAQEKRGRSLFLNDGHCAQCHALPNFQDNALRNIGLDITPPDDGLAAVTGISTDRGKFKNTTLRNIALTAPYMHDGRFETLEQVVAFYADSVEGSTPNLDNHMNVFLNGTVDLDAQDQADLVAFLRALTDSAFVTNPAFSDPH